MSIYSIKLSFFVVCSNVSCGAMYKMLLLSICNNNQIITIGKKPMWCTYCPFGFYAFANIGIGKYLFTKYYKPCIYKQHFFEFSKYYL